MLLLQLFPDYTQQTGNIVHQTGMFYPLVFALFEIVLARFGFQEWWTHSDGQTDIEGAYNLRGFCGEYEVTVTAGASKVTYAASISTKNANLAVTLKIRKWAYWLSFCVIKHIRVTLWIYAIKGVVYHMQFSFAGASRGEVGISGQALFLLLNND